MFIVQLKPWLGGGIGKRTLGVCLFVSWFGVFGCSIVKYWASTTIPSTRGVLRDEDFRMWIDWLIRDGQITAGQVAPSDIYTNEFQAEPIGER